MLKRIESVMRPRSGQVEEHPRSNADVIIICKATFSVNHKECSTEFVI